MRVIYFSILLAILGLAPSRLCLAQEKALLALSERDLIFANVAYEFRSASFEKNEEARGSGSVILALSKDGGVATVNIDGVRKALIAMRKPVEPVCTNGESSTSYQQLFALEQLRLQLKLNLKQDEGKCLAEGLLAIRLDKHNKRYMVKGAADK
jgi:hypothetical protein